MKTYFVLLLFACVLGSSCNLFTNYGKKVEIGESEIFYKGDGVTESNASKLGKFLIKNKVIYKDKKSSVQLEKEDGIYVVRLVVSDANATGDVRLNLWRTQLTMAKEVFDDNDTRFAFTDESFKEWESLPPIKVVKAGAASIYFDNSEFKQSEAKKLAGFLQEQKYISEETEADIFVTKEDEAPVVRFIYDETIGKRENIVLAFSYWQHLLQKNVFEDKKAKIILTSTKFVDFKKVPKITAEQLEQMERPTTYDYTNPTDSVVTQTSSGVERLPNN